MNSNVLNKMGMGNLDIGIILLVLLVLLLVAVVLLAVFLTKLMNLKKRMGKFMQGANARSLEEDMGRLFENVKYVSQTTDKNRKDIDVLFEKMTGAFQKFSLVKYDAFSQLSGQMGGKMSFCVVMLDEGNNGFVLNCVHSTEGCYSYSKEIRSGVSSINLGDEEKQALDMAIKQ
ncbi:MAG: DUF4446 family protein [Lachnospiraceae bacterium]|jgi:hypothetical protein|nr:DUF4446 family protein [Lachnospiraceae bacterium]